MEIASIIEKKIICKNTAVLRNLFSHQQSSNPICQVLDLSCMFGQWYGSVWCVRAFRAIGTGERVDFKCMSQKISNSVLILKKVYFCSPRTRQASLRCSNVRVVFLFENNV